MDRHGDVMIALDRRPAFISEAYFAVTMRCPCPTCSRLDARFPYDGYQLALFPY